MIRWLALALLLPFAVSAQSNYYAASGGLFTNVFPGVTANDTIWITNATHIVTNTANSQTFSNLHLLEGALRFGNFAPVVRGTWVVSNGWVSHYFGGSIMTGGTVSNLQVVGSGGFSNQLYLGLLNTTTEYPSGFYSGFVNLVYPFGGTLTFTGVTNSTAAQLRFLHNSGAVISNASLVIQEFRISANQTNVHLRVVGSQFTAGTSIADDGGSNRTVGLIDSTWAFSHSAGSLRDATVFMTNSSLVVTSTTTRAFSTLGSVWQYSNAQLVLAHGQTLTPSVSPMPPLVVRPSVNATWLAGALSAELLDNLGTVNFAANTVTLGALTNVGSLLMSNSAIYATNITSTGTVTPGTSTLYLLGGTSNLTNYYSLVPVGSCTLTGAAITVTGTLTSQSGASLNAAGGTLTLSNPGLVDGNLQSATVTGNVLRVNGIADKSSGQLNTPRMGRR